MYRRQFKLFLKNVKNALSDCSIEEVRVVITGDIAHQKINISNEQMMLTSWFLSEITKKIGKVVLIPGNHDFLENNTNRLDSITPVVELMNNPNIAYYKDTGVYEDENINWVVYSLYQHNQRPEYKKESTPKASWILQNTEN
jgi:metallophosphoesterase superfamily enzyme